MERRVTSHTEEEEMNQRRRLLTQARKGDQKSIDLLFELYQVKVFSGEALKKKKLPSFPVIESSNGSGKGRIKTAKSKEKATKGSRADVKSKKESIGKAKATPKAVPKLKAKDKHTKRSVSKSLKTLTRSSKPKTISKKSRVAVGTNTKPKKVSASKKTRVAKKK